MYFSLVNNLVNILKTNVDLSGSSNILQIIAERFAKGAANPTEITLAGVVSPSNITGGGSQTYFLCRKLNTVMIGTGLASRIKPQTN